MYICSNTCTLNKGILSVYRKPRIFVKVSYRLSSKVFKLKSTLSESR